MTNTKQKLQLIALIAIVIISVAGYYWFGVQLKSTNDDIYADHIIGMSQVDTIPQAQPGDPIKTYMVVNDFNEPGDNDQYPQEYKYHSYKEVFPDGVIDPKTLATTEIQFEGSIITCKSSGDSAIETKLFYTQANQPVAGGAFSRTAYHCGNEYVIEQFDDAIGMRWAGPFMLDR